MTEIDKVKTTQYDLAVTPDRCMARIVQIDWINPIPGANTIELAGVMGWQCVVGINEFKVNEKCIYVTIDSVMDPMNPNFSFLKGAPSYFYV